MTSPRRRASERVAERASEQALPAFTSPRRGREAPPPPSQRGKDLQAEKLGANCKGVLSLFQARGCISCEQLSGIVEDQSCADVIEDINNSIRFMQLEIRKLVYEVDGVEYWALVNNQPDDTSKLATFFDELQLTFVKALFQFMINTKGMVSGSNVSRCLRTLGADVAKKLTPAVREKALTALVREGWLHKQRDTFYLGPRTYAELRTLIASAQSNCCFCHSACILGQRHNKGCDTKLHFHCARKWFERAHSQKCPSCHEAWNQGEEAEEDEEEPLSQSQHSQASQRSQRAEEDE